MATRTHPSKDVQAAARDALVLYDLPPEFESQKLVPHVLANLPHEVRLGVRDATPAETYEAVMGAAIRLRAVQIAATPVELDLSSRIGIADAGRQEAGRTALLKEYRDQLRLVREISQQLEGED